VFREAWEFTVEKVAVNAVMAGARPEYFPVSWRWPPAAVTGADRAAPRRSRRFGHQRPIRNEIAMNSGLA
jgi:hypothetical protein